MLETVDLEQKLRKGVYKKQRPRLQQRLYALQIACRDAGVPVIIVFEGWDAAGKDAAMKMMTQKLDPRNVTIHDIQPPRTYETHMPWLWRFWLKIPRYGDMAIFYHSWYGRVLTERVETGLPKQDLHKAFRDISNFERALADDGYVITKLFFHISQEEQARRLTALQSDPLSSWRVQPVHWERHNKYEHYVAAIEEMLQRTDSPTAPWEIIPATDERWARSAAFEAVIQRMERALQARGQALPPDTYIEEAEPLPEDEEA
ncbi:MAG TPA: UDP-galactose-lipid carrier transferase [Anaerolineae bacterium]|nr:UDP-galactose-lipid carrier transferase [Anaerolineae bacterium]HQI85293.1 UDP-galactose-lipid carrier transferase [Anaerolineae bacterium]